MKMLYFECNAGVSGDMVLGALTDLLDDPSEFASEIADIGIPGVKVTVERSEVSCIRGTKVHVHVHGHEEGHHEGHSHNTLSNILGIISGLKVSDKVKHDASEIYRMLADAEAEAHGQPVDLVHFHEVGALDAVTDIVGTCMLFERLSPGRIVASPIRTGYGQVRCAHGMLPIPAPATASLLKGIPVYAGDEEGEFCTPTGAAIMRYFAEEFRPMPAMEYSRVGHGLGSKKFETANMLRVFCGRPEEVLPSVNEIKCDIDDMVPEDLGGIIGLLLENGAIDAFLASCMMKKGRLGFELTCLCDINDTDKLAKLILAHTTTKGLRIHEAVRYAMDAHHEECDTKYGKIRIKVSEGYGVTKRKPEFDDLQRAASENGVSVTEVRNEVLKKME